MICSYWGYSAESFDATLAAASCQLCSQPLVFKPTATHLICHAAATQQWPSKTHLFALTGALGVTLCHFISLSHKQPFLSSLCQNRLPPQTLLFVPRTTTLTARRCQLDTLALHWTPVYHLCAPLPHIQITTTATVNHFKGMYLMGRETLATKCIYFNSFIPELEPDPYSKEDAFCFKSPLIPSRWSCKILRACFSTESTNFALPWETLAVDQKCLDMYCRGNRRDNSPKDKTGGT